MHSFVFSVYGFEMSWKITKIVSVLTGCWCVHEQNSWTTRIQPCSKVCVCVCVVSLYVSLFNQDQSVFSEPVAEDSYSAEGPFYTELSVKPNC